MSADLARRALAAGFRWAPGVRWRFDTPSPGHADLWFRCEELYHEDTGEFYGVSTPVGRGPGIPDLADAATLGVLTAQVRAAHEGRIVISEGHSWWSVETETDRWDNDTTASLVEALIAALEAAKEKTP